VDIVALLVRDSPDIISVPFQTTLAFNIHKMATAAVEIPQGWTVNNSDTVLSTDPDKIYEEWKFMREKCPVAYTDRHNGYFILTKYVFLH